MFALDKIKHFVVGFFIALAVGVLAHPIVGAAVAMVAGWGKEQWDLRHPEKHVYDPEDMYATAVGGALGAMAASIVLFALYGK